MDERHLQHVNLLYYDNHGDRTVSKAPIQLLVTSASHLSCHRPSRSTLLSGICGRRMAQGDPAEGETPLQSRQRRCPRPDLDGCFSFQMATSDGKAQWRFRV